LLPIFPCCDDTYSSAVITASITSPQIQNHYRSHRRQIGQTWV
jgi:hypothetical protein